MGIELPSIAAGFDYENNFYLSASPRRISKFMAHLDLYKMSLNTAGVVVECGVFKGVSFSRWAKFRNLLSNEYAQKIVGFDTFASFPEIDYHKDDEKREQFVSSAGDQSISISQLNEVLRWHKLDENIELVKGDVLETLPEYLAKHPELRISLLNVDVDLYGPTKAVLEHLYPHVSPGGVVILDDYGVFPGATLAIEEYFGDSLSTICKFPFAPTPSFIVKK